MADEFKGPRLVDVVRNLLIIHDYNGPLCKERFGVGITWYSDFLRGQVKQPSPDVLQAIYEDATGQPLMKVGLCGKSFDGLSEEGVNNSGQAPSA